MDDHPLLFLKMQQDWKKEVTGKLTVLRVRGIHWISCANPTPLKDPARICYYSAVQYIVLCPLWCPII
jgi:hypothetical protein